MSNNDEKYCYLLLFFKTVYLFRKIIFSLNENLISKILSDLKTTFTCCIVPMSLMVLYLEAELITQGPIVIQMASLM